MGDTIEIVQGTATTVEIAGLQGPQGPQGATGATGATGPQGAPGTGIETLTTKGDLLYRDTSVAARLPIGTSGQILKVAASGIPEWGAAPASGVSSVNGETGAVTLDAADVGAAATNHTHGNLTNDGKIGSTSGLPLKTGTSGVVEAGAFGTGAGEFCEGNDARLSDARTPTSHAASHAAAGSDPVFDQDLNTTDSVEFSQLTVATFYSTDQFDIAGETGISFSDEDGKTNTRSNLGLGNSATLDTGTTAGTVAAGDHTHTQLHDRSHAITSTSDHTAGNHKVFYSNGSGQVVELALGDSGKVLQSNGASAAPTWETPSGGVSAIGTSAADILSVSGSDIVADDAAADRIVFWDDSESKLAYLEAGSGLSISGTTITATASGGSKTYAVFTPDNNQPPSTAFATLDTRNSVACLDFDDATDESAVFVGIIPEGASLGSGLKIRLHWAATTATSGDVRWDVSLERMTTDLDSDSFDTVASSTATTSGTSGILTVTEITLTTIDSVTAGDGFRLKVTRDANNGADTMSGDCELYICEVRSAA